MTRGGEGGAVFFVEDFATGFVTFATDSEACFFMEGAILDFDSGFRRSRDCETFFDSTCPFFVSDDLITAVAAFFALLAGLATVFLEGLATGAVVRLAVFVLGLGTGLETVFGVAVRDLVAGFLVAPAAFVLELLAFEVDEAADLVPLGACRLVVFGRPFKTTSPQAATNELNVSGTDLVSELPRAAKWVCVALPLGFLRQIAATLAVCFDSDVFLAIYATNQTEISRERIG